MADIADRYDYQHACAELRELAEWLREFHLLRAKALVIADLHPSLGSTMRIAADGMQDIASDVTYEHQQIIDACQAWERREAGEDDDEPPIRYSNAEMGVG